MFVVRRTFYCKPGQAGPATALAKEIMRIVREVDPSIRTQRLYTDISGRSDRVILESETEAFVSPRELGGKLHGHPDAGRIFGQFGPLLDHAETEFFVLEN